MWIVTLMTHNYCLSPAWLCAHSQYCCPHHCLHTCPHGIRHRIPYIHANHGGPACHNVCTCTRPCILNPLPFNASFGRRPSHTQWAIVCSVRSSSASTAFHTSTDLQKMHQFDSKVRIKVGMNIGACSGTTSPRCRMLKWQG